MNSAVEITGSASREGSSFDHFSDEVNNCWMHVEEEEDDDMDYEPSQDTEAEIYEDSMFDEEEEIDNDGVDEIYYDAEDMHHDDGFDDGFDDEPMEEDADDLEEDNDAHDSFLAAYAMIPNAIHALTGPGLASLLLHGRLQGRLKLKKADLQVPNKIGRELMHSGEFGFDELRRTRAEAPRRQTLYFRRLEKELGRYKGEMARVVNQLQSQPLIPTSKAEFVIHYRKKFYSGQFSQDGNFFFCCSKDFQVRMYDTSDPYKWRCYKTVLCPNGRWTITDASLSPNNRFLAYSSINTTVYMANTTPGNGERLHSLEFCGTSGRSFPQDFGIWSIRFSGDGREIVAGASNNNLYVYDLETRRVTLTLSGHRDDVNAVCFADKDSPHILFSGSDDTTIKVWDRRSMSSGREVGVFAGHLEGLTYVDSKGDGRYILSNGKDQTMKLWDLRKMMSPNDFEQLRPDDYRTGFDYRMDLYNYTSLQHPQDVSLVTFRGHKVLKTLIRCHFSPAISSGARYVYTGSADGKVHIYNLDATVAGIIDVACSAHCPGMKSFDYERFNFLRYPYDDDGPAQYGSRNGQSIPSMVVRDASWHPNAPVLVGTGWSSGAYEYGSINVFACGEPEGC